MRRHTYLFRFVVATVFTTMSFTSVMVHAKLNQTKASKSVVRIAIKPPGELERRASGFVWQQQNYVVTSLHAMLPKPAKIEVRCQDTPYYATVERVLKHADLVLLKVEEAMEQCIPLTLENIYESPPAENAELVAFGYRPLVKRLHTKHLKLAFPADATLDGLIEKPMRRPMQLLNMPSLDLPIYLVSGGIRKGYSGGPVFDMQGNLVGVVEGGLDKGTSDHNWLIPITNIKRLMKAPIVNDIPAELASLVQGKDHFFSFAFTESENNQILLAYKDVNNAYEWELTKTRSFDSLLQTSPESLGLAGLVNDMLPDIKTSAEQDLKFDIYKEAALGLIIAIPSGVKLSHVPVGKDWKLVANDSTGNEASLNIRHGYFSYPLNTGETIYADDPRYFLKSINEDVDVYCSESYMVCEMEKGLARVIDFGDGNRILRYGFLATNKQNQTAKYHYRSIAVRGTDVMFVETEVNFNDNSAIARCFAQSSVENCGRKFWEPASFMLSAALTNFSNISSSSAAASSISQFLYNCVVCKPDDVDLTRTNQLFPTGVFFMTGDGEQTFTYEQGTGWTGSLGDEPFDVVEVQHVRSEGQAEYVILAVEERHFAVPVQGGDYFEYIDSVNPQNVGKLIKRQL